jgi:hypothetical protein
LIQEYETISKRVEDAKAKYFAEKAAYVLRDAKAREVISYSLDDRHHSMIRDCMTSHAMMSTLVQLYEQKTETSLLYVQQEFHALRWRKGINALGFISEVRSLSNRLEVLGAPLSEGMIIAKVLGELPQPFQAIRDQWELATLGGTTLKLVNLEGQLLRMETRNSQQKMSFHHDEPEKSRGHGHHDKKSRKDRAYSAKTSRDKKMKCFNCNKLGHRASDCWSKKNSDDKSREKERKSEKKIDSQVKKDKKKESGYVVVTQRRQEDSWVAHSGPSFHVTPRRDWFSTYEKLDYPLTMTVGGGGQLKVVGKGRVLITFKNGDETVTSFLKEVLHVPEMDINLFSLTSTLDNGVGIKMTKNVLSIDGPDGVITGYRGRGDLFLLDVDTIRQERALTITTDVRVWHQRLGHIPLTKIKKMVQHHAVEGLPSEVEVTQEDLFCESCVYGKMKRKRFKPTEPSDLLPGEMIHADVCGPLETLSLGKSKFRSL